MLFVGWEGVGLASYLLIGFWFDDLANARAGKKAFIINRIGDAGFLLGMFLLYQAFGTLDMDRINAAFAAPAPPGGARRAWSASCSSSAPPASRRRSRCTSGCPTPWPARRRSRR